MGFGKNNTGVILRENPSVALGTLASGVAAKLGGGITIADDFRMLKAEIGVGITGLTSGEGGQLYFGLCNGELSAAEVEASLEASGPTDRNDRGLQELAERFVRMMGKTVDQGVITAEQNFVGHDGGSILIEKPRWTFSNPEGWDWWIYNNGPDPLTTGATIRGLATIYGLWLT